MANHMIRVDDFDIMRHLDVGRLDRAFRFLAQRQSHFIAVVQLEYNAFEIQQNLDHILLHAVNGRVLVHHTCNGHFRNRIAHHRRQQYSAQGIAQGVSIAALKRLQCHFRPIGADLLDMDVFGFQ